jgi:hypothetical protein
VCDYFSCGQAAGVNPSYCFVEGEARRRGGGTIYAAAIPSPEYDKHEGCAALGGHIVLRSPRCFIVRVNVAVCGGYAEMEGGRRGGTLRRLFTSLGRPQAEYGACPGTEPEADHGRVRPELE